jgi:3-hydroxyacyl-[acyl-carrier-protein] dehydratase
MMESRDIQKILPHRYPFLLIDRIVEIDPGKRGVGLKNLTEGEWFFRGHSFYPPNLLLESLAQVGGVVLGLKARQENPQATVQGLFAGVSDFTFRRGPVQGEQVRLEVEVIQSLASIYKFSAEAFVGEEKIAGGQLLLLFSRTP